jgi:hypothetical protein
MRMTASKARYKRVKWCALISQIGTFDMHTDTIIEKELVDAVKNNAIEFIRIVEVGESEVPVKELVVPTTKVYRLIVKLVWKEHESLVVTQRNKTPKEWASLDRLMRHLDLIFPKMPFIMLLFKEQERR